MKKTHCNLFMFCERWSAESPELCFRNQPIYEMKQFWLAAAAASTLLAVSCDDFLSRPATQAGMLVWSISPVTKAGGAIPDTNQFLLTVTDAKGEVLYDGTYGQSPEFLSVPEGSYTVSARSISFVAPAFDAPLYGDTEVALVTAGRTARVQLTCTMLNSGIRLRPAPDFSLFCPDGILTLSSEDGRLDYAYDETRTAFFQPGIVSLLLQEGSSVRTLFSRELAPREILTVGLSAPYSGESGETGAAVSIVVDTSKVYYEDFWRPEDETAGSSPDHALGIQQAKASIGATGVWVCGYIVGGDLSSSGNKMNTGPEFAKDTHIAIAARASVTDKSSCLSVELPKGEIRDALNLVDHPDLLGHQVWLKGEIVSAYYGITGIKNVKEFCE